MVESSKIDSQSEKRPSILGTEEIIRIIENNRTRIRALVSGVLTVCGLLLSSSFVILFFIVNNATGIISWVVFVILLATSVGLITSITYSILSIFPPAAIAVLTKLDLVDYYTSLYRREYRRAYVAVVALLLSTLLFVLALCLFGTSLLP